MLLYSGGMDSYLIDKIWQPDVKLYVNMHTAYSTEEIERLPNDVIVEELNLGKFERPDSIIPLRNLFLVSIASYYGDEICLGATAGDRVLDKSPEFAHKTSDLLSFLYSSQWWNPEAREIKINLDFKNHTKKDLLKIYKDQGGNLRQAAEESFSCYHPKMGLECWTCKPCFRKFVAFVLNGHKFENYINDIVLDYLEDEIIPQIKAGTYGRKDEEKDIMEAYFKLCRECQ